MESEKIEEVKKLPFVGVTNVEGRGIAFVSRSQSYANEKGESMVRTAVCVSKDRQKRKEAMQKLGLSSMKALRKYQHKFRLEEKARALQSADDVSLPAA